MLKNIIVCLFIAWILTLFEFDNFILGIINNILKTNFTINAYYMGAFIIALAQK